MERGETIDYYNSRSRIIYKDTNSKEPVKIKDATQIVRHSERNSNESLPSNKKHHLTDSPPLLSLDRLN